MMRKPFKGNTYYEWQIGRIVFQVRHRPAPLPRITIWKDMA